MQPYRRRIVTKSEKTRNNGVYKASEMN